MLRGKIPFRTAGLFLVIELFSLQSPEIMTADLKPQTLAAFSRYVGATEARIQKEEANPAAFLYVENLPEARRTEVLQSLRNGNVFMDRLVTRDAAGHAIEASDGIIHHWVGAVFIPGATLRQTVDFVQDYDHHQDFYKPEVVRSKLISRQGNDFKIYLRLRKHKVITVTLNSDHDVRYFPVDATHCYSHSYSTRIAEVADADTAQEREKPVGHDGGFLWRINSYWRFEEKDAGVYVECESVSLTRDIPTGLGWFIRPFITGIPKESLQMTLNSTRTGVQARVHEAARK